MKRLAKNRLFGLCLAALVTLGSSVSLAEAGPLGGRPYWVDRVEAYSSNCLTIEFRGGEHAAVMVVGDGDTDLDLYVYDENGNLIGCDTDYTDRCVVEFLPRWTGPFQIVVVNRGSVYNVYEITCL